MTVLLVVSCFSLVFVNNDFLVLAFTYNRSCNCSACYCWITNNCLLITYEKNFIESYRFTLCLSKSLNLDNVAFRYFVLLTTCCNNCVHIGFLLLSILANYGDRIPGTYNLIVRHTRLEYT